MMTIAHRMVDGCELSNSQRVQMLKDIEESGPGDANWIRSVAKAPGKTLDGIFVYIGCRITRDS
jgi:hypothetical protein